ncbi:PIN domain-containing protein [Micromonospora aurantiaca (nom. illeg.)]|uniref:PIN domain-containing protein n=1 Tax=Micromonospora aurantiaca (nom. illeg.) TaxID=47850 RepID=UPI003EC07BF9
MTTRLELDILRMLRRSAEPLSGRQVAEIAGVAPNTANRLLKALQSRNLVQSTRAGRATRWTTTADVAELKEMEGSPQERVAFVVTAVELEHTEVLNRLVNVERVRTSDIWMVRGEVPGDHINWTIYLARAGMGNATSAALVGLAARDLHANLVAFVGTAAGLRPAEHSHLDVVVGSRIHNPYVGKQVPAESGSKLLGRDNTYVVPAPLVALVNACIADSKWTPSARSQHYNANQAHAYVAPIVSVEAVQADPDGPIMREIRSRFQDAAALDMESFGLAAGSDIHDLPVLAVRGLSDFVGDKAEAGNDDLQPQAAGNAASLLRDVLVFAHPDDFKRGGPTPPAELPGPHGGSVAVALPGAVQMWMDRLERRSPARAQRAKDALAEMRRDGVTAATWLSRALHRPPAWLREDDTGDGWALVSLLASIAGSKVAWRGFEQAAAAAKLTGNIDASAYFTVTARLERIGKDPDEDDLDNDNDKPGPEAMDDFDDDVVDRFGGVIAFYRAVIEGDLAKTKARAEAAIASLGLTDPSGVLGAPEEPVPEVDLDPAVRDVMAAAMLRHLAQMMLAPGAADQLGVQSGLAARRPRGNPVTRDLADDGLRLAQWAVALRPNAEGTRLIQAQTMLGVLVSMSGRTSADVEDEISKRARVVETDALQVRDVLREWDGSSGSALAVAARARSIQGDFAGALRLLLPTPDGVALQREAKHPEVVRLGAFVARAMGNDELALELAAKNPDRVEGQLLRAAVLSGRPQMANEAKDALFAALEQSAGKHHSGFHALMALSRRFNSLKEAEQATVMRHIDSLGQLDRDLADVMRARVQLSQGDPEAALRYVRGLERNELALEAHADALIASGRPEEAAQLVFHEGMRRGDIPLATEALEIAMGNGLTETGRDIALNLLGRDDAKPVRLKALRALQQIARSENEWHDVTTRTQQVIQESAANSLPVPEVEYWRLAEALFFLQRFDKALTVLLGAPAVSFNEREKAQLFLATLRSALDEQRSRSDADTGPTVADLGDPKVYAMFMRAAADWADDEQIAAAAMSVVLMAPNAALTDVQIADFRDYAEKYFERHGENASITQIKVEDDNLDPLIEFLRSGDARQQALEELSREVRAGRFPLAALTEAAGRTCTESLIRRDLGYIMAVDDDDRGEQTAREALGRRVVVDTTALVVAPWTGHPFKKLAAHLDSVIVPASVREDIARARSSLAMRSTATLGWDTRQQRPVISKTTAGEAQAHADAAEQVWVDVQGLQVAPVADTIRRDRWLSAVTVAQELGVPVWVDDVVMRRFARAMGVPAFGTLDLVRAFADEDGFTAVVASLRENRVVDMPIDEPWHGLAKNAEWNVDSSFALALSRPAAWRDIPKAFNEFRSLIRRRPHDMDPQQTANWAHLAANGLAMATIPPARPKAVSALLAWVIFFTDPFFAAARGGAVAGPDLPEEAGRVTELIITVAENLRDHHYPDADALELLVDILSRGLLDSIGPEGTSRIVAALVGRLNNEVGSRVFAAYIQSVGK